LDRLQAWSETLASHLTTSGDLETDELRRLLAEDRGPTAPPRQRSYDDPGESRRRLEAKHMPVAEVRATTPVEEPLEDEVPEPVDDDSDDGQN
jgi:hypothetical protein